MQINGSKVNAVFFEWENRLNMQNRTDNSFNCVSFTCNAEKTER